MYFRYYGQPSFEWQLGVTRVRSLVEWSESEILAGAVTKQPSQHGGFELVSEYVPESKTNIGWMIIGKDTFSPDNYVVWTAHPGQLMVSINALSWHERSPLEIWNLANEYRLPIAVKGI